MSVTIGRTYRVDGMTCDGCAKAVCLEVCAIAGVTGAQVDLATGVLVVTSTRDIPDEAMADAVAEAGYELVP